MPSNWNDRFFIFVRGDKLSALNTAYGQQVDTEGGGHKTFGGVWLSENGRWPAVVSNAWTACSTRVTEGFNDNIDTLRRAQAAGIMHIYRAGESPSRHGVQVKADWTAAKAQLASDLGWADAIEIAPANPGSPDPVPAEFRVR